MTLGSELQLKNSKKLGEKEIVKRQSEDNLFRKNHGLLGLLDLPVVWWFSKTSVFCLSGHLSAHLSFDIHVLDFFDFFHVVRNIQKSRPISVEKGIIKSELSDFLSKVLSFKFVRADFE